MMTRIAPQPDEYKVGDVVVLTAYITGMHGQVGKKARVVQGRGHPDSRVSERIRIEFLDDMWPTYVLPSDVKLSQSAPQPVSFSRLLLAASAVDFSQLALAAFAMAFGVWLGRQTVLYGL